MKSSGSVAGAVIAGRSLDRQEAGQDGAGHGGQGLTSWVMQLMVSRSYPAVRKWVV